ncbi:Nif3-like dinuclear metal center hexameric protein [Algoriphagus sp. D3-2-R+10]|uniref:Nif3-like dinuclear metal center hexameric protein n=1 Tax=Algoriphagus aurantiacus TaxID=3103948 RepID=UPI002B3662A8|nr:Nif3-like dinuclear metal center hexameric protein [Algoriphagus sp. D3-2-R+10]MEB2775686.1 Nif3-like dinuclear metal center hexameric protein [Algoriphagus sp. D3-2-R+10]
MKSNRRNFLKNSSLIISAGLITNPMAAFSTSVKNYTVREVMDIFIAQVPNAPFPQTVDTLKTGSKDQQVTGIVTTMFATITVIRKAIELKANFIIVHEPTFYNHLDEIAWLGNDPVYQFKRKLLDENGIAVWRNHDYVHSLEIDGVQAGVVNELGWDEYYEQNAVLNLPQTTLGDLISHVKSRMNVPELRYVGDLSQKASKILLMPGAAGGRRQMEMIMKEKPDVLICGESPEWETPEYVRNANEMGEKLGLIVIGHSASEEGGSAFMAEWIKKNIPGIPVTHFASNNSLLMG